MASELDEKDFIQESSPKTIWIFLALFLVIISLFWGIWRWQGDILQEKQGDFPFYQVTNRAFSIFLWQNPSYMRPNVTLKIGYLPHFHSKDEIHLLPEYADEYVSAPAEVIFAYHVWNRLLGKSLAPRAILRKQFVEFLEENQEWLPEYWEQAPKNYQKLIEKLNLLGKDPLLYETLPFEVRMAFQGWKNYCKEWKAIEEVQPTRAEMAPFLRKHPHYGRSYWRNVLPDYLISLKQEGDAPLAEDELSDFLKIGFYNYAVRNPSS